ncbi:hypothetical protein GW17_00052310, partial [Ensete ventricosum]
MGKPAQSQSLPHFTACSKKRNLSSVAREGQRLIGSEQQQQDGRGGRVLLVADGGTIDVAGQREEAAVVIDRCRQHCKKPQEAKDAAVVAGDGEGCSRGQRGDGAVGRRSDLAVESRVGSDEEEVPSTSFTTEEAKEMCGSSRQRRLQQRHECDGNVALVALDSEVEKSGGEAAYLVCSAEGEGEVEGVVQVR